MVLGVDWLTIGLSVLTGLVAIFGLFQEHHTKEGKLTRTGRVVIAAIIVLCGLTILSARNEKRDAEKLAHAEAENRGQQFRSQMATLTRLEANMRSSLLKQEELYGVAGQNLRMSADLQQQAQANTRSVLQRVFEESNRIAAERIAIGVTYRCPPQDRFRDNPRILEATLIVRNPAGRAIRFVTRQATAVGDGLVFHGFLGDLGRFETFPPWREARISIRLSGGDISFGSMSLLEYSQLTEDELRRRENPDPVSCPTRAMLFLNGRQVLTGSADFTRLTAQRDYAADFENLRVEPHRLPRFAN